MRSAQARKLFLTTPLGEANICARCGYCNSVCCTHRELDWESTSPRGWLAMLRSLGKDPRSANAFPDGFLQRIFTCTLCGKCGQVCPTHIDLRGLWLDLRRAAVDQGKGPDFVRHLEDVEARERNVFDMPNEERAEWVEFMPDAPAHHYQKERADVLYYVGCVSSFSAAVQGIPKALAWVLDTAGVDFAILGGQEWCCGFPLIVAGLPEEAQALMEHNLAELERLGARTVVFNCPSCYHTWKHYYPAAGLELLHSTQFLRRLVAEGQLSPGPIEARVAYHDPCDLGRNSGVYDEPRELLGSVPGLELVELLHNRAEALCCGGGGDFEMLQPNMTQAIASRLVQEAEMAQVQRLVVACPQCKRIEMRGAEALGSEIQVIDIVELVMEATDRGRTPAIPVEGSDGQS